LAISTAAVCKSRDEALVASDARCTAKVERTNPVNERRKYGVAWRRRERWPRWAQTHLRLSSKEGTVAIDVAITFAQIAGKLRRPTRTPRRVRLIAVEMAETDPYRISRRKRARWE
jgi:hypothetical protein